MPVDAVKSTQTKGLSERRAYHGPSPGRGFGRSLDPPASTATSIIHLGLSEGRRIADAAGAALNFERAIQGFRRDSLGRSGNEAGRST